MQIWRFLKQPQSRVAGVYLIVAALWILFSDAALLWLGGEAVVTAFGTLKGLMFVGVTAAILYSHLRREFNLRSRLEQNLREKIHQAERTQQSLAASERRFRQAVEYAPLPIIIHAEDGEVITLSQTWTDLTGYTLADIPTMATWAEKAYGAAMQPVLAHIDTLFDQQTRADEGTYTVRCADGTTRIWLFSSAPIGRLDDDRRLVMSAAADITEQVRVQQDLIVKDSAIASSITPIALANLSGGLTYVNRAFVQLWGLSGPEEAVGRSVLDFWVSPEDAAEVVKVLSQNDSFTGELTAKRADGTTAEVELTATLVRDASGEPLSLMGSFNDITGRKRAAAYALENERLRARFQKEQERNALVQRVISALSHDLRTPLSVILSSKDILHDYYDQITEARRLEKLDTIGRQVRFTLELLEDTVNMARGKLDAMPFQPDAINVAALCQVSVDEIRSTLAAGQRLRFVNETTITSAILDEVLVSRILLNLISNAVKYAPEDTDVTLELAQHDDWLVLRVRDNGIGITEDDLPHIFEPLYRASNVGTIKGTGLGLSIVKDCVDRHNGRISVESTVGVGTTITVELPFVPDTPPTLVAEVMNPA